jgi:hypothetical protein
MAGGTLMDLNALAETVSTLIVEGKLREAEEMLKHAHEQASISNNHEALAHTCALFVQLYSSFEPPHIAKAMEFSLEREKIKPNAYSKLQTSMVLYYVARDPRSAVDKLRGVIEDGREESDFSTLYSALSLLGQALLRMNRTIEAGDVLNDIEEIVTARKPVVVGDETAFLEEAFARNVSRSLVRRIAGVLAPICQDQEFSRRLAALAA